MSLGKILLGHGKVELKMTTQPPNAFSRVSQFNGFLALKTEAHKVLDLSFRLSPLLKHIGFESPDHPAIQLPLKGLAKASFVVGYPTPDVLVQFPNDDMEGNPPYSTCDFPYAIFETCHGFGMCDRSGLSIHPADFEP